MDVVLFRGLFYLIVIIPSAIIHEYAHAWMADRLGDPTARNQGRLTLNPLSHIDMFGTLLLPFILLIMSQGTFTFAYAKPVPYNPYNLRDQKKDPALVGIAGPASNLILALAFGALIRFLPVSPFTDLLYLVVLGNVLLAVFNMIPVPPLDGSKVLFWLLPDSAWKVRETLERYGFIILLLVIWISFNTGFIGYIVFWLTQLIAG